MKKLEEIFQDSDSNEHKVAIITHASPDPDAIGSSVGIQWLLRKKLGIPSVIFYSGEIDSSENKTLLNVLSLNLTRLEEFNQEDYTKVFLVDSIEQNIGDDIDIDVDVIFDHHRSSPKKPKEDYELVEIRPVGACCTLVYNYIMENEVQFSKEGSGLNDVVVATAMLLGIKTDTNDLLSSSTVALDHSAYQGLAKISDSNKVNAIKCYPLPKWLLEIEREAAKNEVYIGSAYVSFIGAVSTVKKSGLYIIADRMIRFEGITTAVVFGIVDDEIHVSVRSIDVSLDVDGFCKKILGKNKAGGKLGIGGGRVNLGFFNDYPTSVKEQMMEVTKLTMFDKISKLITGEANQE